MSWLCILSLQMASGSLRLPLLNNTDTPTTRKSSRKSSSLASASRLSNDDDDDWEHDWWRRKALLEEKALRDKALSLPPDDSSTQLLVATQPDASTTACNVEVQAHKYMERMSRARAARLPRNVIDPMPPGKKMPLWSSYSPPVTPERASGIDRMSGIDVDDEESPAAALGVKQVVKQIQEEARNYTDALVLDGSPLNNIHASELVSCWHSHPRCRICTRVERHHRRLANPARRTTPHGTQLIRPADPIVSIVRTC